MLRGADIDCESCGATAWRSIAELRPSMSCTGCGLLVQRPFSTDAVNFKYRASELVVRAIESDVLPHLIVLRWFYRLFEEHFGRESALFGGYPGVEVVNTEGTTIGEADVLLLMRDGSLIPGEVKRTASGLNRRELEKLDKLCAALDAPWSFIATLSASEQCGELWRDSARSLPDKPRFAVTGSQLFAVFLGRGLGTNPFAWPGDGPGTGIPAGYAESARHILEWLRHPEDEEARRWRRATE